MNAMLACVDGTYIANDIRMSRTQDPRAVLIVEGTSDELFFERLTDQERCKIEVANGRENAMDAFSELREAAFLGVLVVVDADFEILEGRLPLPMGLLFTDTHDLETMMILSPALDKLLRQVGSKEKIQAFKLKHGEVRDKILASGKELSCLLWLSKSRGLHLKFDGLNYTFVDKKSLDVKVDEMIKAVLNHSMRHNLDPRELGSAITAIASTDPDLWQLCCGHHLTEILAIALCKAIGTHNSKEMQTEQVEHMLMLAYEAAYFRSTGLYASIRVWENINPPFLVLRP